ncbi:hypothetical protein [Microbacterium sp. gxy059]|uniref:hypothetical protein n=1 Tax=Microbacterium sp. gxy059 TaxID=2957199 RepID=UPI003D95F11A
MAPDSPASTAPTVSTPPGPVSSHPAAPSPERSPRATSSDDETGSKIPSWGRELLALELFELGVGLEDIAASVATDAAVVAHALALRILQMRVPVPEFREAELLSDERRSSLAKLHEANLDLKTIAVASSVSEATVVLSVLFAPNGRRAVPDAVREDLREWIRSAAS